MIDKLQLVNFRTHRNTTLNFRPGVNIIVGLPSSGKSNMFRAVRWAKDNRPSSFRMKSRFSGDKDATAVRIWSDGYVVSRIRSGAKITDVQAQAMGLSKAPQAKDLYDVDGYEFSGLSKSVPEEAAKALRLADLNIQTQLAQHFLILDSPGEVARVLNRIIRIEEVDVWVRGLASEINELNQDKLRLDADLLQANTKIKQYDNLPEMEILVDEVESLDGRLQKAIGDRAGLSSSLDEVSLYRRELADLDAFLKVAPIVEEVDKLETRLQAFVSEEGILTITLTDINVATKLLRDSTRCLGVASDVELTVQLSDTLSAYITEGALLVDAVRINDIVMDDELFLGSVRPLVQELETLGEQEAVLLSERDTLRGCVFEIERHIEKIEFAAGMLSRIQGEYWEFLEQLGFCVECGTALETDMIEGMVHECG